MTTTVDFRAELREKFVGALIEPSRQAPNIATR